MERMDGSIDIHSYESNFPYKFSHKDPLNMGFFGAVYISGQPSVIDGITIMKLSATVEPPYT